MLVLGLQGSPRKEGNTETLLAAFMAAAGNLGATTETVRVTERDIQPCKEYIVCEKKGFCPIKDEMNTIYARLRRAEVVVAASPVFFYGVTAQLKALIDRCQTLWARKYKLGLKDPLAPWRRGLLLGVAATRGRQLFDGMELTAKYFFDGISAAYDGCIAYRDIEAKGDMAAHSTYKDDMQDAARRLVGDLSKRQRVLFLSANDACRGQMAGAFARILAGDRLDVETAAADPTDRIDKTMQAVMAEKGIDLGFHHPQEIAAVSPKVPPATVITIGTAAAAQVGKTTATAHWDLPKPTGASMTEMRRLRDTIETRVAQLTASV
ncbi:MAG: NAD(P)H-dependent oxidoreductase [Desulfosarcinaceae bacterium]|nr:NAD(P)H-dependent oxidoreductase [Desulfosarcinaceae bacterium]